MATHLLAMLAAYDVASGATVTTKNSLGPTLYTESDTDCEFALYLTLKIL